MAGTERRLERTIEDIQRFEAILKLLEQNPDELSHLHIPLVEDRLQHARTTLECVEQGKPFLATWYSNAPEICTAMDLHWYTQVAGAFVAAIESPHAMEDLERAGGIPAVMNRSEPFLWTMSLSKELKSMALPALSEKFFVHCLGPGIDAADQPALHQLLQILIQGLHAHRLAGLNG